MRVENKGQSMSISPIGITNTIKPKLLKRVLNQAIVQDVIKENFPNAVTRDTVEILNKYGKITHIDTLRDKDKNIIFRLYDNEIKPYFIKRFYKKGESQVFNTKETLPYKEVSTHVINKKTRKAIKTRAEIFTVVQNQDQKNVVTKSLVDKQKINKDAPFIETTAINQYSSRTPKNYYQTTIKRDNDGNMTEKIVNHSDDNLSENVYNNDYIHTLLLQPNEFKIRIFQEAIQRNGLKDENIKLVAQHLGYTRGQSTQFGYYDDVSKILVFNTDYPGSNYKPFFANITEHELTHARQYQDIRMNEKGLLSGEKAKKAEQYKENFSNYIQFDDNEELYSKQIVEAEALENGYNAGDKISYIFHKLLEKFNGKLTDKQVPGFTIK